MPRNNHQQHQQPQTSSNYNPHLTLRTTTLYRRGDKGWKNTGGLSPNSWANGTSAPVWDKPTEKALVSKTSNANGVQFYSDDNDEDELEDEYYMGRAVPSTHRNNDFGRQRSVSNFELRNRNNCPVHGTRPAIKNDVRRKPKKQVRYQDESSPTLYVPPTDDSASDSGKPAVFVRARHM